MFLSLYKTIAMIGSTTLGKSFASFLYTQILILSFCFAISTMASTKPLVFFSPFVLFSVFSFLNPLFSQPNGNETHRQLSCCFVFFFRSFSVCSVVVSVYAFLYYVDCSASAVFPIDWFHQGTNYEFSSCYYYYYLFFNF